MFCGVVLEREREGGGEGMEGGGVVEGQGELFS